MKKCILVLLCLFIYQLSHGQKTQELQYQIGNTFDKSITKAQLAKVQTIEDINPDFPSSWIAFCNSLRIAFKVDGELKSTLSSTSKALTKDQIARLHTLEEWTEIDVSVWYSNKEQPTRSELREIKFTYVVVPYIEASYPAGYDNLISFVEGHTTKKTSSAKKFEVAIVTFTINEDGQVSNPRITESSDNAAIDNLLLNTVSKMPNWKPAETAEGKKLSQDFELRVGTFVGC